MPSSPSAPSGIRPLGYDELNRKQQTTYALAPGATSEAWREVTQTTYVYDQNSNRTEVHEFVASGTDPPGGAMDRSIRQTFDALDRVKTETTTLPDGGTKEVAYDYFPNGTRSAVTLDGKKTEYEYDGQNRVKTMTASDALVTAYSYYPDDLLKDTLAPNGVIASRTYDKADRLLALTNAGPTGTLSSYAYTYDHNGNRLTQTEINPAVPPTPPDVTPAQAGVQETTTYTYDAANRLKSVTYPVDGKYPNGRKVTYVYDKVGNREHETETTPAGQLILERAAVFDENNRLNSLTTTTAPPTDPPNLVLPPDVTPADPGSGSGAGAGAQATGTLLIAYDNKGNETVRIATNALPPDAEGNPQPPLVVTTQSVYDVKNRLVEQGRDAQILTRHEYDADGRRTKKIGEEGIRQYVYDDTSLLAEYSTDGVEVAKYDYGADRLIRLTRADEGTRYMSFDGLGSVTGLTNPSGDVTATYHLDAWGNYRFTSELETSHNRFGFTGHYWDKEASLYYAKARYYDPFTARFTQADSFLGTIDDPPSLHRYFYANANPISYVDPTGHDARSLMQAAARGEGLNYLQAEVSRGVTEAGQAAKEWLGHVGMSISIASARTLSARIDPETGEISYLSPGHNPTPNYEAGVPQPQNATERLGADVADLLIIAAPLITRGLPKRETVVEKVSHGSSTVEVPAAGPRPVGASQPVTAVQPESGGTFLLGEGNTPLYARARLKASAMARDPKAQARLAGKAPGDHAGHLLGARFGFEGGRFNLTPMSPKLNLGSFKRLENLWARLRRQGNEVDVEVFAVHRTNPQRADQFAVFYSVDGGQPVVVVLDNPLPARPSGPSAVVH